jgi:hypothetical protein
MFFGITPSASGSEVARPCWHCTHYLQLIADGAHARCGHGGRVSVQASPASGCAFWQREPGADDEPGRPESMPFVAPGRGVVLALPAVDNLRLTT